VHARNYRSIYTIYNIAWALRPQSKILDDGATECVFVIRYPMQIKKHVVASACTCTFTRIHDRVLHKGEITSAGGASMAGNGRCCVVGRLLLV
jgi:hypothetical protein